jgi:hypothetical protein
MDQSMTLLRFDSEQPPMATSAASPQAQLEHYRNVTNGVMQEALSIWADLWGELQSGVARGVVVAPEAEKWFRPSCGWPEFLEKMWLLRTHLDFTARFTRQPR